MSWFLTFSSVGVCRQTSYTWCFPFVTSSISSFRTFRPLCFCLLVSFLTPSSEVSKTLYIPPFLFYINIKQVICNFSVILLRYALFLEQMNLVLLFPLTVCSVLLPTFNFSAYQKAIIASKYMCDNLFQIRHIVVYQGSVSPCNPSRLTFFSLKKVLFNLSPLKDVKSLSFVYTMFTITSKKLWGGGGRRIDYSLKKMYSRITPYIFKATKSGKLFRNTLGPWWMFITVTFVYLLSIQSTLRDFCSWSFYLLPL